jgi:hypothetical protein
VSGRSGTHPKNSSVFLSERLGSSLFSDDCSVSLLVGFPVSLDKEKARKKNSSGLLEMIKNVTSCLNF